MKVAILPVALLICSLNRIGALAEENPAALTDPQMTKVPYFSTSQTPGDTADLQAKVLNKINQALTRGSISPAQATTFEERLNNVSDQETWYKSRPLPIPASVLAHDTELLTALSKDVEEQLHLKPAAQADDAMHRGIHRQITTALAQNKITNEQAERYYASLAQIEADMESLKNDPAQSAQEAMELNKKLDRLQADLKEKH